MRRARRARLPKWPSNAIGKVADDGSVGRDGPSRRPARHTCPTGRAETRGRTGIIYYWVEIRSGHALWEMSATMRTAAEKKTSPGGKRTDSPLIPNERHTPSPFKKHEKKPRHENRTTRSLPPPSPRLRLRPRGHPRPRVLPTPRERLNQETRTERNNHAQTQLRQAERSLPARPQLLPCHRPLVRRALLALAG